MAKYKIGLELKLERHPAWTNKQIFKHEFIRITGISRFDEFYTYEYFCFKVNSWMNKEYSTCVEDIEHCYVPNSKAGQILYGN